MSTSDYAFSYTNMIVDLLNKFNYAFLMGDWKTQIACLKLISVSLPKKQMNEAKEILIVLQRDFEKIEAEAEETERISDEEDYKTTCRSERVIVAREKFQIILEESGVLMNQYDAMEETTGSKEGGR